MITKTFSDLIEDIAYLDITGPKNLEITGITYDSRTSEDGYLFVAIKGKKFDGHDYITDAFNNGAKAAAGEKRMSPEDFPAGTAYVRVPDSRIALATISDLFYDKPTEKLFSVGITGTNGKTTTAHLTKELLGSASTEVINTVRTAHMVSGQEPVTTPESSEVHRNAYRALQQGKIYYVVEVSSHGLAMERVGKVDFDMGIFTNLTRDHLDYHLSMEEYANSKLKLFRGLSQVNTAIVNNDDDFTSTITEATKASTITYGISSPADVTATGIEASARGVKFRVVSPWGSGDFFLPYIGTYNVYNALPAITVGLLADHDLDSMQEVLHNVPKIPGRMEKIGLDEDSAVFVDFAHNPGGLEHSLSELNQLYPRVSVIFGCGGLSDRGKRPEMGRIASSLANEVILTNDNPKSENPDQIIEEIESGIPENFHYDVIPDRKAAIEKGLSRLDPGEALLIAGKGHERFQVFEDEVIEFNDADYVREITK